MDARDLVRTGSALWRSGLLTPRRPDRLLGAGAALMRYGASMAAIVEAGAALDPDAIAIIDERGRLTRRELAQTSRAAAAGLIADRSVASGRRVALLARDSTAFARAVAAVSYSGADLVLMNTGFSTEQALDVAAREGCQTLIADAEYAEVLDAFDGPAYLTSADSGPAHVTSAEDRAADHTCLDDLVRDNRRGSVPAPSRPGRVVILTSGTTGAPKGAQREAAGPSASGLAMLNAIPYRTGETWMVAAPLFHSLGFAHLSVAMALQCPLLVRRRFDPVATLTMIASHRARVLVAVPVMLRRLVDVPAIVRSRFDTSSLRVVPLSGSAIPSGLAEAFMDAFGDCLYNLYGSTEIGYVSVASPRDLRAAPGTAGRVLDGVSVRLLDADDREMPPGATGRIFVRSPLLFSGYTDGGAKQVVDGHMSTGDTGHFDEADRLFIDGRDDDMVVSGGENVFPREVEDVITSHPAVLEAAVIGVPDAEFGQRLDAYVVARPGEDVDANMVRRHVRDRLARFKVPRDVHFVAELPRNPSGKVVRSRLG